MYIYIVCNLHIEVTYKSCGIIMNKEKHMFCLDNESFEMLNSASEKYKISKSGLLRILISKYLRNGDIIESK